MMIDIIENLMVLHALILMECLTTSTFMLMIIIPNSQIKHGMDHVHKILLIILIRKDQWHHIDTYYQEYKKSYFKLFYIMEIGMMLFLIMIQLKILKI